MNVKAAKLKSAGNNVAMLGGVIAALGLAYLFLTPKSYQALARIKLTNWVHVRDLNDPTDLSVIPAECDRLRSKPLLLQVVRNLQLENKWTRRDSSASRLGDDEAVERLRLITVIKPVPSSSIIEIRVSDAAPDEAAAIANELARVYLAGSRTHHAGLVQEKLTGLKKQWDEQNEKISAAQSRVDDLYFKIRSDRATNQIQYYDAETYQALLTSRADLETNWETKQDQLSWLKKKSPDDLKQFLLSQDDNSRLARLLAQVNDAKSHLAGVRSDHGENSSEVKQAVFTLNQLQKSVDETILAMLRLKQVDVEALKSTLDAANQKIKFGRTNVDTSTPQESEYNRALAELNKLKSDRADLQEKMKSEESQDAIMPATTTAQMIDSAEQPTQPAIPSRRAATMIMGGGALIILCGLALIFVSQRRPKSSVATAQKSV
jgi:uncharacterized protein involved in exopolysaccharide biosynthesis